MRRSLPNHLLSGASLACLVGFGAGCQESTQSSPFRSDASEGSGLDAAAAEPDAGVVDAAGPTPDAGPPPVTNHPDVTIDDVSVGQPPFRLISSAMRFRQSPGLDSVSWFARMENTGSVPQCSSLVTARFLDAAGAELFVMQTFLRGDQYRYPGPGTEQRATCVAAGDTTCLVAIELVPEELDVETIASIEYVIGVGPEAPEPHPLTPILVSTELREGDTVVVGVLRNDADAAIGNLSVEVFPIQADGLILDALSDAGLGTLLPGESVEFETLPSGAGAMADYEIFVDFLPGTDAR